jgi:rod shape-determining protein MreD
VPLRIFGLRPPEPVFPMVCAFAWAVIRPSVLAPFAVLGLGLFLDLYWGGPLGLWGLSLLAAYAAVLSVRSVLAGEGFAALWAGYAVATGLAMAAGIAVTLIRTSQIPDLLSLFWQFAATVALYPFAHLLIQRYEDADVRFR